MTPPPGGEEGDRGGGEEGKKSERKRQRERQRRYDLANAFEELGSLLSEIEPEEVDGHRRRRRRSSAGDASEADPDSSGMTRLDLIGRGIEALRRLYRENAELKRIVESRGSGDDKEVLVMVPTLTAVDSERGPSAAASPRGSYPPPYYPQHYAPPGYGGPQFAPPPPMHPYYSQPPWGQQPPPLPLSQAYASPPSASATSSPPAPYDASLSPSSGGPPPST